MALPDVTITVQDNGLGIIPASPASTGVVIGVFPIGTPLTLYVYGGANTNLMLSQLGPGMATEALAAQLLSGGNPVMAMPATPDLNAAVSTTTHVGTGAGTVTGSQGPDSTIAIVITNTGAIGAGKFTYKVGTNPTSQPITIAASFLVPGTLTTLTFNNNAGTFVATDTFSIATTGVITAGGGNAGTGTITAQASNVFDQYQVLVTMTSTAAAGTATYTLSLDGGITTLPQAVTVNGAYNVPGTGLVLAFSGNMVSGDTYSLNTVPSTFSTSAAAAAIDALVAAQASWGFIHLVQPAANAAGAATMVATVETHMSTAALNYQFAWCITEAPSVGSIVNNAGAVLVDSADTDAITKAAFASTVALRTAVAVGDFLHQSQITTRQYRRNAAWQYANRAATKPAVRSFARVKDGALTQCVKLYRDESSTPALSGISDGRFCTLRSFPDIAGFYCTNGYTLAQLTSDFRLLQRRQVMDVACKIVRTTLLSVFLEADIATDPKTAGHIAQVDKQLIEATLNNALLNGVVNTSPPSAVKATATVDDTNNILSTGIISVTVVIVPRAYAETIAATVQFAVQQQ